jgi:outer membrane receptor protein involved in Fe transport
MYNLTIKRISFTGVAIMLLTSLVLGQGVVRGKISDENGEPLTGATVYLETNMTKGTISDFDGNYTLNIPSGQDLKLVVSFISYTTMEVPVHVEDNKVAIINLVMQPSTLELEDVVITRKVVRSNDIYMQMKKARSAVSLDFISSETIKKTGDSDIFDATKRITGVSTVGDFITVRGLADRYIKTTINGSRIPTLDPFTNNIELDIFPTSLVDNIIISKTMSPNLPGDWAGAYLSIETKDYPERLNVNISFTMGYNAQTTFQEIVTSESGPMDWLGMDGGFRDIENPDSYTFPLYNPSPSPYEQYQALGLKLYFSELNVTPDLITDSPENIYFNLGQVELGLLPPASIYDFAAIQTARQSYYHNQYITAFETVNSDLIEFSSSLSNNMTNITEQAPFDFSQEFSIGNQISLFGNPMGILAGFRYYQEAKYDPNAYYSRGQVDAGTGELFQIDSLNQQVSSISNGWSGLVQMAYKINNNNSISLMFMPNFSGKNRALTGEGSLYGTESNSVSLVQAQIFEERRQLVYQAETKHYFPNLDLRLRINGSIAKGNSKIPDYKRMNWLKFYEINDTTFAFDNVGLPRRNFRYLSEDIYDFHIHGEFPLFSKPELSRKIEFGGAYQYNSREYQQYEYSIQQSNIGFDIKDGDLESYFAPEKFKVHPQDKYSFIPLHYTVDQSLALKGRNSSIGHSSILAGFAMVDLGITSRFRISGGLRLEWTDLFSDMTVLLGQPRNSYDRQVVGAGNLVANYTDIDTLHFLPSINLIYQLISNDKLTLNARANYSKSIARPSIREVSYTYVYDYEYRIHVLGNPDLKIVEINNFDFRIESFFTGGNNASLSLFYKNFENHIEIINDNNYYTWINTDESRAYGLEFESTVSFLRNFEFRSNVTLISSLTRIDLGGPEIREQGMYGQAPYVVNALLSYSIAKAGISVSAGYNIQGPKLAVISRGSVPNIMEEPENLIDFKISKSLGKNFGISFKIRNLLSAPSVRVYEGTDLIYDQYNYGRDFRLTISYHLN